MPSQYQFRFNDTKWSNVEFSFESLDEIQSVLTSVLGSRMPALVYPELYKMILEHHRSTIEQTPNLFKATNPVFLIQSNQDDVLKVAYAFELRFASDEDTELALKARAQFNRASKKKQSSIELKPEYEPVTATGLFTIMPGNE